MLTKILLNQILSDIDSLIKDVSAGFRRDDLLLELGRIGNKVDELKGQLENNK